MMNVSSEKLADAASFLPPEIRAALAGFPDGSGCATLPKREVALLSVDIVGFSGHTKALLESRSDGAEVLHADLQAHYQSVLATVLAFGGEPIAFVGDGLLVVWPARYGEMDKAVHCAAGAGHALAAARLNGEGRFDLNLHVSCGDLQTVELGGANQRWLSAPLGTAVLELQSIAGARDPNKVLLTHRAAGLLAADAVVWPERGPARLRLAPQVADVRHLKVATPSVEAWSAVVSRTPRIVGRWIERVGLEWIAELRPVTVLTVALRAFDISGPDAVARLETAVRAIQEIVHGRDGTVDAVVADEKGASVLVFFGTPPNAHSDDPRRSVLSAMEIVDRLGQLSIEATVGVGTGRAFCGVIGTSAYRAYLVTGDVINLSSRLAWALGDGVLVDPQTYQATVELGVYDEAAVDLVLKGMGRAVPVWAIPSGTEVRSGLVRTAGRKAEVAMLRRLWAETLAGEAPPGVIIDGESGSGKTNLALDLRDHVQVTGGNFALGTASVADRETPYSALRWVLSSELGVLPGMTLAERRSAISANLPKDLLEIAPLLDAIFPTGLAETQVTADLTGAARTHAIGSVVIGVLQAGLGDQPSCLCLDDAQWLDAATIQLLLRLRGEMPNLLLILLCQTTTQSGLLDDLVSEGIDRIRLQPLTRDGLAELAQDKLGVGAVADDLLDLLEKTAAGHPFFSTEILASLQAGGHIAQANGRASLAVLPGSAVLTLPDSLHGMVLQRLDHPEPEEQLSLRVASVAGMVFPTKMVADIHPLPGSRGKVHKHMLALSKLNLVEPRVAGDRPGYGFRMSILRDVAYHQVPQLERSGMHAKAAEWIEANSGEDRVHALQELADHWEKAGQIDKAIACLLEESLRLFRQGFAVESVRVGLHAIRISGVPTPDDASLRGADIGRGLGALHAGAAGWQPDAMIRQLQPPSAEVSLQLQALLMTAPFAFQSNQFELFAWMSTVAMQRVIENRSGPPPAFSMFSIVIAALTGDRRRAAEWSRAALDLDAAMGGGFLPAVGFIHTWFHGHWQDSLMANVAINLAAGERGLADGDMQYASYNLSGSVVQRAAAGQSLPTVLAACDEMDPKCVLRNARVHIHLERQFARALRGETDSPVSLTGMGVSEEQDIAWVMKSDYVNQIGYYLGTKLRLMSYAGDRRGVLLAAEAMAPLAPAIAGQTAEFDAAFHTALARLWLVLDGDLQAAAKEAALAADLAKFQSWAQINPHNFGQKAAILRAMHAAIAGNRADCAQDLARLVEDQRGDEGLSDRAIALECALFLNPTEGYAKAAVQAYTEWGALGVARRIADQGVMSFA